MPQESRALDPYIGIEITPGSKVVVGGSAPVWANLFSYSGTGYFLFDPSVLVTLTLSTGVSADNSGVSVSRTTHMHESICVMNWWGEVTPISI